MNSVDGGKDQNASPLSQREVGKKSTVTYYMNRASAKYLKHESEIWVCCLNAS
jgi:hypothetical protein